jgi:uncharacterized protein DUF6188
MLRHTYGLKKELDLSFLTGRDLIQLAIVVYQVQFGFDEDVRISVESEFRCFDGQAEWNWRPEPGASSNAARTVALLGAKIESFGSNIDGTLTLAFSNQHRLTILDSFKECESYDIIRPGQTIIVWYSTDFIGKRVYQDYSEVGTRGLRQFHTL